MDNTKNKVQPGDYLVEFMECIQSMADPVSFTTSFAFPMSIDTQAFR